MRWIFYWKIVKDEINFKRDKRWTNDRLIFRVSRQKLINGKDQHRWKNGIKIREKS
jgi:hypothetical protein